jgi:hypothetical protein
MDLRGSTLEESALTGLSTLTTTLDISHCTGVCDEAVAQLAQRCPRLTDLDLTGCGLVTDAALFALATGCPGLNALRLGHCTRLTALGLVGLVSRCRLSLTLLDLTGCWLSLPDLVEEDDDHDNHNEYHGDRNNTTFAGSSDKHTHCPVELQSSLRTLVLAGCQGVTDAALTGVLARSCAALTKLDLSFCSGLSLPAVSVLQQSCPGLLAPGGLVLAGLFPEEVQTQTQTENERVAV